jgi:exopolysaccharide production protein ExoQ
MLPLVFLVRTLQRGMHISFIIGGVLTAIIAAVGLSMTLSGHAEDPVNGILRLLGKDDTLTGRSVLWDFGMQSIEDHPILGIGYLAYWVSPATSSAYLTFVIDQQLEMFHNVFVEVTVALGFVGLFFFVTGLAQLIWRSLVYLVQQGTVMSCWPFLFTVWVTMLSMSENPIFGNTPFQFILTAGAAATFACDPRFTKRS